MYINGTGFTAEFIAPDIVQQLVARKDNTGMLQKLAQQLVFLQRQYNLTAAYAHLMLQLVDLQPADADDFFLVLTGAWCCAAAQHSLNARNHLQHTEGLGNIIIGTAVQALDLIELRALGRSHNHRYIRITFISTQTP